MDAIWIVVLGLAWGNPDSRVTGVGEVLKIERVEVSSEAECLRAAKDWTYTNVYGSTEYEKSKPFATCAGRKPTP
jgi:hypothetical protein